jgi:hypothetical protein
MTALLLPPPLKGDVYVAQRTVKLSGSRHATLAMSWSLATF